MPLGMAHLHDARVRSVVAVSEMEGPGTRQDWAAKPAGRNLGHLVPFPLEFLKKGKATRVQQKGDRERTAPDSWMERRVPFPPPADQCPAPLPQPGGRAVFEPLAQDTGNAQTHK